MGKTTNNILTIIIIALTAGLFAGAVGEILTRNYIFENIYGIPFSGEWDFSGNGINRGNVVIEGAKKIVVEQNERLDQVAESASKSIVGIFKKKKVNVKTDTPTSTFKMIDSNEFYDLRQEYGQGLILTADGWILTDAFADLSVRPDREQYIIITNEGKIKEIDEIIPSADTGYQFLHVKDAQGLPVKGLADKDNIQAGNTVLVSSWPGNNFVTSVINNKNGPLVRSSDSLNSSLELTNQPENYLHPAFIFDLNENVIGILNSQGEMFSIVTVKNQLNSLLKFEEIKKPILGVNYINLADIATDKGEETGALIYPDANEVAILEDSPADKAGLKPGDIITAVNNQKINKDTELSFIIQKHLPGDMINVQYERNGEEHSVNIELLSNP